MKRSSDFKRRAGPILASAFLIWGTSGSSFIGISPAHGAQANGSQGNGPQGGNGGANQGGPFDDNVGAGQPSGNGNGGNGNQPCAGCVGNADDKNPPGQGLNDPNAGYECDRNSGVGRGNPAHSGCGASTPPSTGQPPSTGRPPQTGPPTTGRPTATTLLAATTTVPQAASQGSGAGAGLVQQRLQEATPVAAATAVTPPLDLALTGPMTPELLALAGLCLGLGYGLVRLGREKRPLLA